MARIETDPNYSTPTTFPRATEGTDLFKKEDIQNVSLALSNHAHGAGQGLPVARIADSVITGANIAPGVLDLPGGLNVSGDIMIDSANWAIMFVDSTHYLQARPAGQVDVLAWTHDFSVTRNLVVGGNASVQGGQITLKPNNLLVSDGTDIFLRPVGQVKIDGGSHQLNCEAIYLQQGSNQVIYWRDQSHYLQYAPAGDLSTLFWTHNFEAGILRARTGVSFPNGSITNAMLATPPGGGATVKNSYFQTVTWTDTTLGSWVETPIQATASWTGAGTFLRIDWMVTVRPVTGTVGIGIGIDGVLTYANVGAASQTAGGSQANTISGFLYVMSPSAGSHKVSVFAYSGPAGNGLDSGTTQSLVVTEYKS